MNESEQRTNIKDFFDNMSSFPRKYTIISILITYIIINVVEYYISQTKIQETNTTKKVLTKNDLLLNAIFVLKNVSLVLLILCMLPLIDPIPIISTILFEKTLSTKKYMHIIDIINKYTVNPNRLKQMSEELQEHIDKLQNLNLFDSTNDKTDIHTIISNISGEINNNWKKIQNKYWFPSSNNISKFREFIKKSDALELIDRKFYVQSDIFQSDATYNIKVLEKISINLDLINYFFTTDLINNLNNSSIKEIFGCLIEYYYEGKILNNNENFLEDFLKTIKSLSINKNLKESTIDILKIFSSSGSIKELDTSLDDHTINYYSEFTKDIYLDGNKKLDANFIKEFNSKGTVKIDIYVLVETLYNSMIKKYPYLIKKHLHLTNDAFDLYKTPNVSKLNIESKIKFSKFKELHFTKSKKYIDNFIPDSDLDNNENNIFLNEIKKKYTDINNNNIDSLFNWFNQNLDTNNETEYYNYLYLLYNAQLSDTHLKNEIVKQQEKITSSLQSMQNYIIDNIEQYPLKAKFPSKLVLNQGSKINEIVKNLKDIIDGSIPPTDSKPSYLGDIQDILDKMKGLTPWMKRHLELTTARMIYKLKLALLEKNEWDYLENPTPYKKYEEIYNKVTKFATDVDTLTQKKQTGEPITQLTSNDIKTVEKYQKEIESYISNPQMIDIHKQEYTLLAEKIKLSKIKAETEEIYDVTSMKNEEELRKAADEAEEAEEAVPGAADEADEAEEAVPGAADEGTKDDTSAEEAEEAVPGAADEGTKDDTSAEEVKPPEEVEQEEEVVQEEEAEEAPAPAPAPEPKKQFGGTYDVNSLQIECDEGVKQIDNIISMRADIMEGMNYNIKEFNDAFFSPVSHPIAILNIDMSNVFCILFNIVYLILIIKSNNNYHSYHKFVIYSFYAVSMLYILNTDKTLNHIMNNIQLCKFVPYLIIFRTILYLYSTVYGPDQKTQNDISDNKTPFELYISTEKEDTNKRRTFTAVKLLASSTDLITLILLILMLLNYLKPFLLSTKSNDSIEIFDFDMINNTIRQKKTLNFSITDNYLFNKTIFNTHPISEKILILFDKMNISDTNEKIYFGVNILWKIIGFSLIMQIYYKIKASYRMKEISDGSLVVEDSNAAKEDISKYFDFKSQEFSNIFIAYLIIIFLMFGPDYMTIISWCNNKIINGYGISTEEFKSYSLAKVIFMIVVLSLVLFLLNAFTPFPLWIIRGLISIPNYFKNLIYNQVWDGFNDDPFQKAIGSIIISEIILYILAGVFIQWVYINFTGETGSLYYKYNTIDIINNFHNVINKNIPLQGGSGNILNNYKNIFIIIILSLIIFTLNKIKKHPKNIMNKKKDKLQKGGNEFFTTFIFKHLLGVTGLETEEATDHIREIGISIVLLVIVSILMTLGINISILNQLLKEIFYDNNYVLLLIIIIIPSIRYIYTLYKIWKKNNKVINIKDYIRYHFNTEITGLNTDVKSELDQSQLEIKVHTLLAVIIGIFLSLALTLTHNVGHTIIVSIAIILFIVFFNFGAFIIWNAFIKESSELFVLRESNNKPLIKYISQNIEETGKIVTSNNNRNKEDMIIINKMKTDIIKDLERLKTSFNIRENIIIGIDDILNKWNYERYTHNSSGTYIDIVDLRRNLKTLNSLVKLNDKQTDEKEILNRHEEFKNLYDGVWEKNTTNEKKNIIERILIKTYGNKYAIGILFNSAGYIIKKYNLRISVLNEASNGKNNIKLHDTDSVDFVLYTQDINNQKYLNYEKYNSSYKKLIDMGSDIKNIETFLSSGNDFFKKINYILDPVKDVSYIIKYKLLEDFNEYRKIENDVNKKCLSSLLIQRIYKKILLIKCITEEKYEEAEQLQNDLNTIELKYNDLSLLSINRNDISLATHEVSGSINSITLNMTNLIGNVLRFKDLGSQEVIKHEHIHIKDDKHKHTVEFFRTQKADLETAKNIATDPTTVSKLEKQIAIVTTNLQNAQAMVPDITTKKYIGSKEELDKDHTHEHIHINNGSEQTQAALNKCEDLDADNVPTNIWGIMNGNLLIKTYKKDDNYHELILKDIITSAELETLVNSLKSTKKYTDFHTGHLEFNVEYIVDKEVKSKPYKINLLGKDARLELDTPLSAKSKSYLKNIKVEGYYFDADADNICKTTLVIKNNIKSLIIYTYDMTDEFCI